MTDAHCLVRLPLGLALLLFTDVLCAGSEDNVARVWNLATGNNVLDLIGHSDYVNSVAQIKDNRVITGTLTCVHMLCMGTLLQGAAGTCRF